MAADVDRLQRKVEQLQAELQAANEDLLKAKSAAIVSSAPLKRDRRAEDVSSQTSDDKSGYGFTDMHDGLPLLLEEYSRYGRQLIMPEIGIDGQLRLRSASVLVIGAGGLGCPAVAYLAGAGVGRIGIVDGDTVETSNLHRQICHTTERVGSSKADSVKAYVQSLNPLIRCHAYLESLSPSNYNKIMSDYDLMLDCTDTPSSRYLISDAAVLLGKPLVSASALRTEGQLVVLNHPVGPQGNADAGPCYRCVFPNPPPPETVMSCGEGGILGPVVGVMGVLQALEAIKLLTGGIKKADELLDIKNEALPPTMLVFSAYDSGTFRSFKLRGRRKDCRACSTKATLSMDSMETHPAEYSQLCGAGQPTEILSEEERVHPRTLAARLKQNDGRELVLDVREKAHFDVFNLPGSINIPHSIIDRWQGAEEAQRQLADLNSTKEVHVICRLGNDSQSTVRKLKALGFDDNGQRYVGDVAGGWRAWCRSVPGLWPDV